MWQFVIYSDTFYTILYRICTNSDCLIEAIFLYSCSECMQLGLETWAIWVAIQKHSLFHLIWICYINGKIHVLHVWYDSAAFIVQGNDTFGHILTNSVQQVCSIVTVLLLYDLHVVGRKHSSCAIRSNTQPPAGVYLFYLRDHITGVKCNLIVLSWKIKEYGYTMVTLYLLCPGVKCNLTVLSCNNKEIWLHFCYIVSLMPRGQMKSHCPQLKQ